VKIETSEDQGPEWHNQNSWEEDKGEKEEEEEELSCYSF